MGVPPLYNILIPKYIFAPAGSGYTLYSRLIKITAKKPCFSKSGDAASILHAISAYKGTLWVEELGILKLDVC
ncbi:hypothetical protein DOS84_17785 [Flavobacterium aquariorum]|uniref:Uncharacterized protein n=1 Tax=Flavobacterium aquariorum TaxID=2217670 RepID=A0A2W7TTB6_9FLAO|nr:hypothetical protein DOS84_17785 [Flavobacterium aquariorum]